jgi:hypothetical protein
MRRHRAGAGDATLIHISHHASGLRDGTDAGPDFNWSQDGDGDDGVSLAITCSARHSRRGSNGVTKDRSMSKKPSVKAKYHAKKDRLEITIKRSGLKKKSERKDLVKHLDAGLARKAKGGKPPKNPQKETKIPEVGD